jgi:hypothetical protein
MRLSTGLRDTLAAGITSDVGATGFARFYDSGGTTLLASASLNNPAFPAPATGVITLDVTPAVEDTSPAAAGTCIRLGFYPAATGAYATDVFMLGVATAGTPDVTMSNNVIATTDTVQVASLTVTVPAGVPDDS